MTEHPYLDWHEAFVVIGSQDANGVVMLMASTSLTQVELEQEYETRLTQWGGVVRDLLGKHNLTVRMGDYVAVEAPCYAQAWQKLFDLLSPPAWSEDAARSQILTHYTFNGS